MDLWTRDSSSPEASQTTTPRDTAFDVENHGQILVTAAMNSHPLSFECFQKKKTESKF